VIARGHAQQVLNLARSLVEAGRMLAGETRFAASLYPIRLDPV